MGTKLEPGKFDCYENALADEPMFVLLARDPSAPALVQAWADRRQWVIGEGRRPESERPMVTEALDCAVAMEIWRREHDGHWRDPERIKASKIVLELAKVERDIASAERLRAALRARLAEIAAG